MSKIASIFEHHLTLNLFGFAGTSIPTGITQVGSTTLTIRCKDIIINNLKLFCDLGNKGVAFHASVIESCHLAPLKLLSATV